MGTIWKWWGMHRSKKLRQKKEYKQKKYKVSSWNYESFNNHKKMTQYNRQSAEWTFGPLNKCRLRSLLLKMILNEISDIIYFISVQIIHSRWKGTIISQKPLKFQNLYYRCTYVLSSMTPISKQKRKRFPWRYVKH